MIDQADERVRPAVRKMLLLDTNVLIYAFDSDAPFYRWARDAIVGGVAGGGAAINAVSLAEICVGEPEPASVADRIRSWGVEILDVPAAAAEACAKAYLQYRKRRASQVDIPAPAMPLADFFIGAHAKVMDWPLATADRARFQAYFPSVALQLPS